ncbi:Methyltransferase domain-containing protein [Saccharopolyspora shandongensis]|uniref:Methyltransferase domain-containing protein n=1 Tax=Saccharopolyspora shandongensis TaxID=418495 RepID=A0A1H3SQK8_9PSEU|nr:class I SAM-dependent methyltransferase [Saccharopolyspora shandongensis]SDZ40234.1 Methyltransferase domain-containing protein [Saccharopolyspora shandongensis]
MGQDSTGTTPGVEAARFWDKHYRIPRPTQANRANPVLAEIAGALTPGSVLDLGCGSGGDALWLAARGWRVTAVDISASAVRRLAENAQARGLHELISAECVDLAEDFPEGSFDLVSAQYFQTPFALPRSRVLRTAAHALRPGGRLVVVDHGSTAPWSWNQDPGIHYPTPDEVSAEIALDSARWRVERAGMPRREAKGPGDQTATVIDNVLVIRRTAA